MDAKWTLQWYGYVPGELKVKEKLLGVECIPESQRPSGMQLGEQAPDVVECEVPPLFHVHITVSPTVAATVLGEKKRFPMVTGTVPIDAQGAS